MKHVSPENLVSHYKAVRQRIWDAGIPVEKPETTPEAISDFAKDGALEERQLLIAAFKLRRLQWEELSIAEKGSQVSSIMYQVAGDHKVSLADLQGREIRGAAPLARQEAYYRLYHALPLSMTEIGKWFGGRLRSTVEHGIYRHAERHGLPEQRGDEE